MRFEKWRRRNATYAILYERLLVYVCVCVEAESVSNMSKTVLLSKRQLIENETRFRSSKFEFRPFFRDLQTKE